MVLMYATTTLPGSLAAALGRISRRLGTKKGLSPAQCETLADRMLNAGAPRSWALTCSESFA
eukprot:15539560-Heterocapsa_arctica.AAC.1